MPGPIDGSGGGNYGDYDPYDYGTDEGWGEDYGNEEYPPQGPGAQDEYVGGAGEEGGVYLTTPEVIKELEAQFKQIKADKTIPYADRNRLLKEINGLLTKLKALHTDTMPAELAKKYDEVQADVTAVITPPDQSGGADGVEGDGQGDDPATLKKDLTDYKTAIQNNPNLTPEKKTQYTQQIDQWLNGLDLKTLDVASIQPLFDQLKTEVTTASAFSPAVQSLAQATGSTPEEIDSALRAKGLDPSNLPQPPTLEVIQVAADLSSEFNGKLEAVQSSVKARNDEIKTQTDKANAQNSSNVACSSDNDNTDMTAFQYLYDAKYHQDQKSKDVMNAQKDAVASLLPILKAMYPGVTIEAAPSAQASGYNDLEKDYNASGLLSFNGTNIDLFRATDGQLQASTTQDSEPTVGIVKLQYDNEGSGGWGDKGSPDNTLVGYGDAVSKNAYDS